MSPSSSGSPEPTPPRPNETSNSPRGERIPFWRLLIDHAGITPSIRHHDFPGAGTEDDPFVVSWIANDPRNPMEFSMARKIVTTIVMGFATFVVSFTSSAYVGSMKSVEQGLGVGNEVATLGLSLFVLGFALGPLFWAPLSETIGRQIPFFFAFFILAAFSAGCAGAQSIEALLVQRFFAGAFGSAPLTNAGGIISDMFDSEHRGIALCIYSATPYLGPSLGPLIGGFLSMSAGWRWVEGFLAASALSVWVLVALLVPETYAPVLLRRRAAKLTRLTGAYYESKLDLESDHPTLLQRLKTSLSRPWILLVYEPIVALVTFYASIIYGTLYMLFGAFPIVYEDTRGWNPGVGGLPFLGVAVGTLSGAVYVFYDNERYVRVQKHHNGRAPPEARLPPCMISSICIPVGLLWFAWSNGPRVHWLASVAALVPFGFGMILVYNGLISYLLDAYTIYSASVLSSLAVVRYMFGVAFPLFTRSMYDGLGIHWASSVPALIAVACVPIPFGFYRYGAAIRRKCKFAAEAARHAESVQEVAGSPDDRGVEVEPTHEKDKDSDDIDLEQGKK